MSHWLKKLVYTVNNIISTIFNHQNKSLNTLVFFFYQTVQWEKNICMDVFNDMNQRLYKINVVYKMNDSTLKIKMKWGIIFTFFLNIIFTNFHVWVYKYLF